ncbi:uncharacterized protein ATNIH1004_001978 [Aspergillus tanneri]|uniref:Uncharacterized protein n=1 Tax=Aspergillus tanneri TaxID=1220188 RepID=A0A5M9M718_9EURO|nr:uncharacterized protein ATNIH1004_001978 [Aspergillus tanneri]KAA8641376.1 hypothetical protein ATNIH1004_001978 [Aspergillus tanneri]
MSSGGGGDRFPLIEPAVIFLPYIPLGSDVASSAGIQHVSIFLAIRPELYGGVISKFSPSTCQYHRIHVLRHRPATCGSQPQWDQVLAAFTSTTTFISEQIAAVGLRWHLHFAQRCTGMPSSLATVFSVTILRYALCPGIWACGQIQINSTFLATPRIPTLVAVD